MLQSVGELPEATWNLTPIRDLSVLSIKGHERAASQLAHALTDPSRRLVTVTGFAGVGKTFLAVHVLAGFKGVRKMYVRLADVDQPDFLCAEMANQLGCIAADHTDARGALCELLIVQPTVLLLDGFERMLAATSELHRLLAACRGLCLVVTSRVPLNTEGETVVRLEPYSVVAQDRPTRELLDDPAVALFLRVAADAGHPLPVDRITLEHVVVICRLLEGIRAAIEIAATLVGALAPAQLVERLERGRHLTLLGAPQRGHPVAGIQPAVLDTVGLLATKELEALVQLCVFASWFTLESASVVCERNADELVDILANLVDANVVEVAQHQWANAFRMRRVVREAARDLLSARPVNEQRRLADALAAECRRAMSSLAIMPASSVLQLVNAPREDLHQDALGLLLRALDEGDAEAAALLASGLASVWWLRGRCEQHRQVLCRTQAMADAAQLPLPRQALLTSWCSMFALESDRGEGIADAAAMLERACVMADTGGEPWTQLVVFGHAVWSSVLTGQHGAAATLAARGVSLAEEVGDPAWSMTYQIWTAMLHHQSGDTHGAVELAARALAKARSMNDVGLIVRAGAVLAVAPADVLQNRTGRENLAEIIDLAHQIGDAAALSWLLPEYACHCIDGDDLLGASKACIEGLELLQRSRSLRQLSLILPVVVTVAALSGHPLVAAGLSGSDGDPASSVHDAVSPARRLSYAHLMTDLRCQLGDAEFERSAAGGRRKLWNDVVRTAIDFLSQLCVELEPTQTGQTGLRPSSTVPLSRREREVLTLLAEGSSNKEISRTLGISAKTVMHHTSSIYRKLGVRGRVGAAARIASGEV